MQEDFEDIIAADTEADTARGHSIHRIEEERRCAARPAAFPRTLAQGPGPGAGAAWGGARSHAWQGMHATTLSLKPGGPVANAGCEARHGTGMRRSPAAPRRQTAEVYYIKFLFYISVYCCVRRRTTGQRPQVPPNSCQYESWRQQVRYPFLPLSVLFVSSHLPSLDGLIAVARGGQQHASQISIITTVGQGTALWSAQGPPRPQLSGGAVWLRGGARGIDGWEGRPGGTRR